MAAGSGQRFSQSQILLCSVCFYKIFQCQYTVISHSMLGFNSRGREFTRGQWKLKCVEGPSPKNIYGHL